MRQRAFARSAVKLAVAALLVWAVLGLVECYYMPGVAGSGGTARASIGLGKALPANLTGTFTLIVGGPGMSTISRQYQLGTTTSEPLTIPSGASRTFTLIANTPSVTLIGQQTVDLAPGETKDVTLTPVAAGSQIIAPDYDNSRLVQVSDMKGTGWTELSVTSPYDVDFDSQGKLYVAGSGGVIQMDDISGANPTTLTITPSNFVYSIAMDRSHGILYYTGTDANGIFHLGSIQVTPTLGAEKLIDLSAIFPAGFFSQGIAVDSDGFLYMVTSSPSYAVVKINPNATASPVASYSSTLTTPWDVLVKGDYVYLSDEGDSSNSIQGKIVRLSKNLDFVDEFSGPDSDPFQGPERFVAILNKPITVVDGGRFFNTPQRLASFGDMTGAGWTTYGSAGSGQDQFNFYSLGS